MKNRVEAELNGYKSSLYDTHICSNCKKEFNLSNDELLYTYPPYYNRYRDGYGRIVKYKSRIALEFCSYKCRALFIKQNPDIIKDIDEKISNLL